MPPKIIFDIKRITRNLNDGQRIDLSTRYWRMRYIGRSTIKRPGEVSFSRVCF